MSVEVRIFLEHAPVERAEAEVAVVSFFQTDRPLRGAAGRSDWRMCGMLSELLAAGHLEGRAGESLLVPTFDRLRAPRLLLLGLGVPGRFGVAEVGAAANSAVARLLDLRVSSATLALPGGWSGAVPVRPAAEAVARGTLEALAERPAPLALGLLVPEAGAARALRGLEAVAGQAVPDGLKLRFPDLEPPGANEPQSATGPADRESRTSPVHGSP